MLIPLEDILFGRNVSAGMNPFRFMALADKFRSTSEPCDPPVVVTAEGRYYRVHAGRHRVIGAIIAGRTHIEAEWLVEGEEERTA